jgi:hypothetical protein
MVIWAVLMAPPREMLTAKVYTPGCKLEGEMATEAETVLWTRTSHSDDVTHPHAKERGAPIGSDEPDASSNKSQCDEAVRGATRTALGGGGGTTVIEKVVSASGKKFFKRARITYDLGPAKRSRLNLNFVLPLCEIEVSPSNVQLVQVVTPGGKFQLHAMRDVCVNCAPHAAVVAVSQSCFSVPSSNGGSLGVSMHRSVGDTVGSEGLDVGNDVKLVGVCVGY